MVNNDMHSAGRRGGVPPGGDRPGGGIPDSQHGRRTGPLRGGGCPEHGGGGGVEEPPPLQHNSYLYALEGGDLPSTEEGADLHGFNPARTHLLLREVYEDFPHRNY